MRARTALLLTLAALLLPLGAGGAGFHVEGKASDGFPESAGVVAVLPAICLAGVDCAWLDRHVAGEIQRRKSPKFVPVETTRRALARLGLQAGVPIDWSAEDRRALGEALGAETLLEIRVRELEKYRASNEPDPDAGEDTGEGLAGLVRGRLEIRAVAVSSGTELASGAAFGEVSVGSEKRLLGPMATQLLGRMFPLSKR